MDIFAAIVGLTLRVEPISRRSHRAKDIADNVIRPAKQILKFLRHVEYRKEFLGPWKPLNDVPEQLQPVLAELIQRAERQIAELKAGGKRGARTATDLKRYHVRCADALCAFFKHDFAPHRGVTAGVDKGAFLRLVELLAEPVFESGTRFDTVVKEYVEGFNEARAEANLELMA